MQNAIAEMDEAILELLASPTSKWESDNRIAEMAGTYNQRVAGLRKFANARAGLTDVEDAGMRSRIREISKSGGMPRIGMNKYGKLQVMDVSRIGKGARRKSVRGVVRQVYSPQLDAQYRSPLAAAKAITALSGLKIRPMDIRKAIKNGWRCGHFVSESGRVVRPEWRYV